MSEPRTETYFNLLTRERLEAVAIDLDRAVINTTARAERREAELAEVQSTLDATVEQFEHYVADNDHSGVVAEILASRDRLGNALRAAEAERDQLAAAIARVRAIPDLESNQLDTDTYKHLARGHNAVLRDIKAILDGKVSDV